MSDTYQVTVIQTENGIFWEDSEGLPTTLVECQWFALCDNPAMTTLAHPVLGDVPICNRCKDKVAK